METLHLIGPEAVAQGLFDKGPIPPADAFRLPLVLPTARYSVRRLIEAAVSGEHLKATPVLQVDGIDLIYSLIKGGFGYTIFSSVGWAARFRRNTLGLVETAPAIHRPLSLI